MGRYFARDVIDLKMFVFVADDRSGVSNWTGSLVTGSHFCCPLLYYLSRIYHLWPALASIDNVTPFQLRTSLTNRTFSPRKKYLAFSLLITLLIADGIPGCVVAGSTRPV
jgi:hypothetical protein